MKKTGVNPEYLYFPHLRAWKMAVVLVEEIMPVEGAGLQDQLMKTVKRTLVTLGKIFGGRAMKREVKILTTTQQKMEELANSCVFYLEKQMKMLSSRYAVNCKNHFLFKKIFATSATT